MNLPILLLSQHQRKALLLAGRSLLTASFEMTPPDGGYLPQEVGNLSEQAWGELRERGQAPGA